MKEKHGNFIFQLFFKLTNTKAIALPWCTYYKYINPDLETRIHEACHFLQYRREGVLRFIIKYALSLHKPHHQRPLEIEALDFAFIKMKVKELNLHTAILSDDEYIEYLTEEEK